MTKPSRWSGDAQPLAPSPSRGEHADAPDRDRQSWIGGNAFNPGRADFVPPSSERVKDLMDDLVAFVNRTDFPPVVHAAIAHAQFETIHPSADGNGRAGRALINVVLRRRGVAPRYVPPVSLVAADRPRLSIVRWAH